MTWEKRLAKAKKYVEGLDQDQRWALLQALAGDGRRFYGDGGTIHHSGTLDVCQDQSGAVTQVWFRCQNLPFTVSHGERELINPDMSISGVFVSDSRF